MEQSIRRIGIHGRKIWGLPVRLAVEVPLSWGEGAWAVECDLGNRRGIWGWRGDLEEGLGVFFGQEFDFWPPESVRSSFRLYALHEPTPLPPGLPPLVLHPLPTPPGVSFRVGEVRVFGTNLPRLVETWNAQVRGYDALKVSLDEVTALATSGEDTPLEALLRCAGRNVNLPPGFWQRVRGDLALDPIGENTLSRVIHWAQLTLAAALEVHELGGDGSAVLEMMDWGDGDAEAVLQAVMEQLGR